MGIGLPLWVLRRRREEPGLPATRPRLSCLPRLGSCLERLGTGAGEWRQVASKPQVGLFVLLRCTVLGAQASGPGHLVDW
ncbi:hypothetical protein NDU88_001479 [Pleurodeles waltl]|uniref:Uncharacterized protein n=1 Tax=Pleurodeles waltl TaxID=8319 RepID=A0AAV7SZK7_PLEWA|nr:hypothetical protein NDU88_001479 [Pleurodeles waltl]